MIMKVSSIPCAFVSIYLTYCACTTNCMAVVNLPHYVVRAGIKNPGEDQYRPDLTLLYFPTLDAKDGSFKKLEIRPLRVFQFQLQHANEKERTWLASMLNWQCKLLASEARAHYSSDHPSSKDPHVVIAQNGALQLQ
mmetsp:Transcript_28818/g.53975  ORF Transcript_28818/g.53975 Transcript_28818/m.53975 type:complete len:137 (-) Transcript_28818:129-539(-)